MPNRQQALFLDRDGIINVDHGYVGKIEDFEFMDGIFELVRSANELGYLPVVITNQSGIGRGYFSEEAFLSLTEFMKKRFHQERASLDHVYYCPYHPEAAVERYREKHPGRKPEPGMYLEAATDLNLDLVHSVAIGDQWRDVIAAHRAGVRDLLIVGEPKNPGNPPDFPVARAKDLFAARDWLVSITQSTHDAKHI